MPIDKCPFTLCNGITFRPILPIKIINPHSRCFIRTFGIIDTGADECAIPASFAPILGHNLQSGTTKKIKTGNGETTAYSHTTSFEIYHPATSKKLHAISDIPIDFLPNLEIVLLGVDNFLSTFILTIDYPKHIFSIKHPK